VVIIIGYCGFVVDGSVVEGKLTFGKGVLQTLQHQIFYLFHTFKYREAK